jgi:SAM-dependent methyltransferase
VDVARSALTDPRVSVQLGVAERLSFPDGHFGLVVSTTSFDHWDDQAAGLAECRRVLAPDGSLVLVDLFARWLAATLIGGRRGKARTPGAATELLRQAGFGSTEWRPLYAGMIRAVVARA